MEDSRADVAVAVTMLGAVEVPATLDASGGWTVCVALGVDCGGKGEDSACVAVAGGVGAAVDEDTATSGS